MKMQAEGHQVGAAVIVTVDPKNDYKPKIFSMDDWQELETKILQNWPTDGAARTLQRLVIGLATECTIDANGCIELPDEIRDLSASA